MRCPRGGGWHRKKYNSLDLESNSSGSDQEVPAPFIRQHPYPEYIPGLGKLSKQLLSSVDSKMKQQRAFINVNIVRNIYT